jgi:hypothetical protein
MDQIALPAHKKAVHVKRGYEKVLIALNDSVHVDQSKDVAFGATVHILVNPEI